MERRFRRHVALAVGVAAIAVALPASGASLTSIGVLDPANPSSQVRGVSSDGSYAVGTSRAPGGTINVPVVWSLSSGLVALPNPSGQSSLAHGVAVGIGSNTGNIIISGLHENNVTHRFYKAPLTNLAGGTWTDTATAGGLGSAGNVRGGTSNVLRNQIGGDGRWYTSGQRNDTGRVARYRGDPSSGWDGSGSMTGSSVSGYGVVVGRYTGVTPSTARWDAPSGDSGDVPGSGGDYRTDGIGISPSFGKSTSGDFDVQWLCGQDQSYTGSQMQAWRWKRGDPSLTLLGTLPGDTSSVAYTIADNGVTAGRSFRSGTPSVETAVVWDTSGTWDTTGTAQPVKTLLENAGVDTSMWSSLVRVYAASDDGRVLAGYGIWAADNSTRGFVAVIPEPATLLLLALGGLALNRRRRG